MITYDVYSFEYLINTLILFISWIIELDLKIEKNPIFVNFQSSFFITKTIISYKEKLGKIKKNHKKILSPLAVIKR